MIDEDRVDGILQRIIGAIKPDQGPDGFDSILAALQDAISFQIAFACPTCRERFASDLRDSIPVILKRASQINPGDRFACSRH